jgi:hypothetical protein
MTDWDRIQREKELHRASSAALPFEEKLRILARLRERDRTFKEFRELANVNWGPSAHVSSLPSAGQTSSGPPSVIVSFGANEVLVRSAGATPAMGRATTITRAKTREPDR